MGIPNMESIRYQQILNQNIRHFEKIYSYIYFVCAFMHIIQTFIMIIPTQFELTSSSRLQMMKKT